MKRFLSSLLKLSLSTLGFFCVTTKASLAQVTSDGTTNTQVNQNANVAEITGGERRGSNLFHSFQDFSVPTGNEAFFNNNADNISNIFSRVTGGNISNIDGAIRANGSANLFLINPAGIIFGENARLDIGGSFYGSSASSILFEDGEFSAVDNLQQPVLTVNAPIGLGFRDEPGDIISQVATDNVLAVANGQNISLIGGSVSIENGGIIFAPEGRVQLGGLLEAGAIAFTEDGNFSFPENVAKGNVTLSNDSRINVTADEGGSVDVNAKNLSIASGSGIFAGINVDGGTLEAQSGDITINLEEDLVLDGANGIENNTVISNSNFGTGNAGNIEINARNVSFVNSGAIASFNSGQGSTGDISINATGDIVFDGVGNSRGGINNFSSDEAAGTVGNISLQAQNLTMTNGANLQSLVSGEADGGDISINVVDTINIDGFTNAVLSDGTSGVLSSNISSIVNTENTSNSGNIVIETTNLFLSGSGFIDVSVSGQGTAGNITIDATDTVSIDGAGLTNDEQIPSRISANIGRNSTGNAGNIQINSPQLLITNNSYVSADILSGASGNGGTINLEATELSLDNGSYISADILSEANGNGGNLNINATELNVANNSFISADIFAEASGDGGNLNINATKLNVANNSFISTDVRIGGNGNAGNLLVDTAQLSLKNGGQISATTSGSGDAGSLSVNASESIILEGFTETITSGIFASALVENGNGGNVNISTKDLTISDRATIIASNFPSRAEITDAVSGTGEPGNIFIAADSIELNSGGNIATATQSTSDNARDTNITLQVAEGITLQDNSFISARALNQGNGGNLSIDSRYIIAFPSSGNGSDIIATAQQGRGGNININSTLLGIQENTAVDGNSTNNIDASSEFSLNGDITVDTPDNNIIQGTIELPSNVIEPGETRAQACQTNREAIAKNSLAIVGRGGVTTAPDLPLSSQNILVNEETDSTSVPQPVETSQGKIQPARGIEVTKSGEVMLTAYRTNNSGERIAGGKVNCGV